MPASLDIPVHVLRLDPVPGKTSLAEMPEKEILLKAGILGGTFDPIHFGHLRTAEEIGQGLDLEAVYLIPSASPPHKTEEPVSPFSDRLEMARLAVGDSPLLRVLDLEGRRPGLSYSIETLRQFRRMFGPNTDVFFILGTDAFSEIETWKEYRKLFEYAHFVIIQRAGYRQDQLESFLEHLGLSFRALEQPGTFMTASGNKIMLQETTLIDISSTQIRKMVAGGRSIRFLVPEEVRTYVMRKGLYKSHGKP
jgi:nicotinate-nucleotide adenylyltransferase